MHGKQIYKYNLKKKPSLREQVSLKQNAQNVDINTF